MNTHIPPRNLIEESAATGVSEAATIKLRTRISRTYRFESAHHLPFVPDGHKCKAMHGHNYRVDVIVSGPIDSRGFIKDFAEIDAEVIPLIRKIDHRVLNDIDGLENPTAEVIAAWFFERMSGCECVRVYENEECWAEVLASAG